MKGSLCARHRAACGEAGGRSRPRFGHLPAGVRTDEACVRLKFIIRGKLNGKEEENGRWGEADADILWVG